MEIDGGEEPVWRENVKGGYKIKMVMDSGACKTIVPPNTLPNMKIVPNKDTGRNFRAANGKLFPHLGETKLQGKSQGGGKLNITAQVAKVTKPLAAGGEIVDAGSWIILNKKGGAIVKLDAEAKKEIEEIVKRQKNPPVPIKRERGTFVMEVWVPKPEEVKEEEDWKPARKVVRQKAVDMEVDVVEQKNYWEAFWSNESGIFQRPV